MMTSMMTSMMTANNKDEDDEDIVDEGINDVYDDIIGHSVIITTITLY